MTTDNKLTHTKLTQVVDSANRLIEAVNKRITAIEQKHQQMEPLLVPVGVPMPWPAATPPAGFFKCDGSVFDKNQYPQLAAVYPNGVLPDLRGEFIRGWDDGRGVDAERQVLSWQKGSLAITDPTHNDSAIGSLIHADTNKLTALSDFGVDKVDKSFYKMGIAFTQGTYLNDLDLRGWEFGYGSSRPRNIAFLYIVRAA